MPANINDFERYAKICEQDNTRYDILESSITNIHFLIPVAKTIIVKSEDVANLPGLAARHLNNRFLWYVLLHYNGLYDQITDMYAGMKLNIPQIGPLLTHLKKPTVTTGIKPNSIIL